MLWCPSALSCGLSSTHESKLAPNRLATQFSNFCAKLHLKFAKTFTVKDNNVRKRTSIIIIIMFIGPAWDLWPKPFHSEMRPAPSSVANIAMMRESYFYSFIQSIKAHVNRPVFILMSVVNSTKCSRAIIVIIPSDDIIAYAIIR